jgi:hypothetical protein
MNIDQPELELGIELPVVEEEILLDGLVRDIVSSVTVAEFTPYQIHSVVNKVLEALGTEYRVRPQMMYNYDRNGLIVKGAKDQKRYTEDEVASFVIRFVERNRNR